MKLLDKIGREFSGYNILESGKRLLDRKPLQCSLYVLPLPAEVLEKRLLKLKELGTFGILLTGGVAPYS